MTDFLDDNNNNFDSNIDLQLSPVIAYNLYRRGLANNLKPDGFDFDMNQFENLIDQWTSKDDIINILGVKHCDLDKFCRICYNADFNTTYGILLALSNSFMNRSIKGLAQNGNSTALAIVAKHFLGLDDEPKNSNVNIKFVNDLEKDSK